MRTSAEATVRANADGVRISVPSKEERKVLPALIVRILETQSPAAEVQASAIPEMFLTPRRRGQPRKAPAAPKAFEEFDADESAVADD